MSFPHSLSFSPWHVSPPQPFTLWRVPGHLLVVATAASLSRRTSDGNSQKNHMNQPKVLADICAQLAAGERHITGVMIESHINGGRQDVPPEGPGALKHGVSITDACVDWSTTVTMLDELNAAVARRREKLLEQGLGKPALNGTSA